MGTRLFWNAVESKQDQLVVITKFTFMVIFLGICLSLEVGGWHGLLTSLVEAVHLL